MLINKIRRALAHWRVEICNFQLFNPCNPFSLPLYPPPREPPDVHDPPQKRCHPSWNRSWSDFSVILLLSFSSSLFDTFLYRFLLDFPPQLASENRAKSTKNWFHDALYVASDFQIDFWCIFALNLDPQNLKNRAPAAAGARFLKKSPFEDMYVFDAILGANLHQFPS